MCLVALAIDQSQRFPLVLAANRDEYFRRPAARLAWWSPPDGGPDILAGRDLESGGTWLGLSAAGRLALLTNVRDPRRNDPSAPSRGSLVPLWLRGDISVDRYWTRAALAGHNGFNLIAADFQAGECFHLSNRAGLPRRLERGLYGLANAGLDTPWPKVERLKQALRTALNDAETLERLNVQLFDALADRTVPPDGELPATGVALEWERLLAPAFIRSPDQAYGTRCSTLLVAERTKRRVTTHVFERSYGAGTAGLAWLRHAVLDGWPPRYALDRERDAPPARHAISEAPQPFAAACSVGD